MTEKELICDSCDETVGRLDVCLRCDGQFCHHCMAFGFCESCIEEMGLVAERIEQAIEQQEDDNVGSRITWTQYERGIRIGLRVALSFAKGERLP